MRGTRCAALLVLSSLVLACRASLPAVDDASFDALVAASPEAWVLEVSSPRCGTCRELAPLYAAAAERLGGAAAFGEVDIDTESGMALARRLGVLDEGVPNVRAWARRDGPAAGERVFAGWELPTQAELEQRVVAALAQAVRVVLRAACWQTPGAAGADAPCCALAFVAGRRNARRAVAQGVAQQGPLD